MNKIYDKLLLVVAVLMLLAGVGFYVMKTGDIPGAVPAIGQPGDALYQVIPAPVSAEVTVATWPDATETTMQPPLELYDVFTPPAIYLDNNGTFIFKPPYDDTKPTPPFGVYLAKIERDPYRIQLEGYIEEDLTDASKSLLLLFDEERQQQVRARVGQEKPEAEISIINFTIEKVRDSDNNVSKTVIATLLDQRTGEEVSLVHGERLYNDSTTIILRSKEDPAVEIQITEVPQTFETSAGKYILEEINLEESSVTVKKLGNDEFEAETEQLFITAPSEKSESIEAPDSATQADDSQGFDFAF